MKYEQRKGKKSNEIREIERQINCAAETVVTYRTVPIHG